MSERLIVGEPSYHIHTENVSMEEDDIYKFKGKY